MRIHERVLEAALQIGRTRGDWTFRPAEVVAALPELNAGSVRTHVMSRCCVNAPAHHSHRWPYFRRTPKRGVYEILPDARKRRTRRARRSAGPAAIRVEVREVAGSYVAESPELPGSVRGPSLDAVAGRLRRLTRERPGTGETLRLQVDLDLDLERPDPVLEVYRKEIDRTLIRRNLRLGVEERLRNLQHWLESMAGIRGAARRPRRKPEP